MSQYYDHFTDEYERVVVPQRFLLPARELAKIVDELPLAQITCLDIGTGSGIVAREIRSSTKRPIHIVGLDSSEDILKMALNDAIDYPILSKLPTIPLIGQSLNLVTAGFVLSHVSNLEKAIFEINRVLSFDGYFVFSNWAGGQKHYNELWSAVYYKYISKTAVAEFRKNNLPNEDFLGDDKRVTALFEGVELLRVSKIRKEFSLNLSLKEYLDCRFLLLSGKFAKSVLSSNTFEQLRQEMTEAFTEKFGVEISYLGKVNFYIYKKGGN